MKVRDILFLFPKTQKQPKAARSSEQPISDDKLNGWYAKRQMTPSNQALNN
jgi:hypothetical protein